MCPDISSITIVPTKTVKQTIIEAIGARYRLYLKYDYRWRTVEPHVLGSTPHGLFLLCYQVSGESYHGGLPQWRRLKMSRITKCYITSVKFIGKRPCPSGYHTRWLYIYKCVQ